MKFSIEEDPSHFLDTSLHRPDNVTTTSVYTKKHKFPVFWTSKIPNKYKKNAIRTEIHRAQKIGSDFNRELQRMSLKYSDGGYPKRFIDSVIREFNQNSEDDIIPNSLFEDKQA